MRKFPAIRLALLLVCVSCNVLHENRQKHLVVVVWATTKEHHCFASIVTTRAVLTACTCVGKFLIRGNYYQYKRYKGDNFAAYPATTNIQLGIKTSVAHRFCRTNEEDQSIIVHDLGAWVMKEPFDQSYRTITIHERLATDMSSAHNCSVFENVLRREQVKEIGMDMSIEYNTCIERSCKAYTPEEENRCKQIFINYKDCYWCLGVQGVLYYPPNINGSSLSCVDIKDQEDYVWGVAAGSRGDNMMYLWSKLDCPVHLEFIDYVRKLTTSSSPNFNPIPPLITTTAIFHILMN